MKKQNIQEESNNEDDKEDNKKQGFGEDLEQAWYKRSPLWILKINMLFQTNGVMLKEN